MMKITAWLEKRSTLFWVIAAIACIAVIAILDTLTGFEIALSLFYLLPIALLTWYTGKRAGIAASIGGAGAGLLADLAAANAPALLAIPIWNSLVQLGIFLTVTWLVAALKKAHEREKDLARTDGLTGAVNARYFSELVHMETVRSLRNQQPFTIVCVDLDNFKSLNDRFGLSTGDKALCTIVAQAKTTLRKVDVVARVGGDEFAFLLPETNQAAAQAAMTRVQATLLEELSKNNWPVTFSMGVLTCVKTTQTSDELIKRASEMMYWAKQSGTNSIHYSVYAS